MDKHQIQVQLLGQSGCKLIFPDTTIYVDPYLSDSVKDLDSPDLERLIPIPIPPDKVSDADWVLITHDHIDHCDPHSLPDIAKASPQCQFIGPLSVLKLLEAWGVDRSRLTLARESWSFLSSNLRVCTSPAAHPAITRDEKGNLAAVGYLFDYGNKRIYFAGDTAVTQKLIDYLQQNTPIHSAFLPVNEHNFFRGRQNILGNMTIREAFLLAEEVNIRQVIPVHWDMFAVNAAYPEEIKAIYHHMKPDFQLLMSPSYI
jgi:L-ascorbate metabolism protein UlaG (beta-lactamase superfamily)